MNDSDYANIAVSSRFSATQVSLSQTDSVEAYLTLTNQGSAPIQLTFNSGQLYDIYLYDAAGEIVSRWSQGHMFTQACQQIILEPGQEKVFGDRLELKDLSGQRLGEGVFLLKIELQASLSASGQLFQVHPFTAETSLNLVP